MVLEVWLIAIVKSSTNFLMANNGVLCSKLSNSTLSHMRCIGSCILECYL